MRRIIIHSVIFILVTWFWVTAPLVAYFGLRDELQPFISIDAWDTWKTRVLGPIDADTRDDPSNFLQHVLLYGEWLFGYLLLALAALTAGRAFRKKSQNRLHVLAYAVTFVVAVTTIIFGGSISADESQREGTTTNPEASTLTTESPSGPVPESDNGWSAVYETNLAEAVDTVLDGANYFLSNKQFSSYAELSDSATEMQRLFGSALNKIDYLLRIIAEENRPKRELTLSESRLRGLRTTLVQAIDEVEELLTCAQAPNQDGDCQEEMDRVYQLAYKANNTSVR